MCRIDRQIERQGELSCLHFWAGVCVYVYILLLLNITIPITITIGRAMRLLQLLGLGLPKLPSILESAERCTWLVSFPRVEIKVAQCLQIIQ